MCFFVFLVPNDKNSTFLSWVVLILGNSFFPSLATIRKNQIEQIVLKFEMGFFIAIGELPLTKFRNVLDLEKHHKVKVGKAYKNSVHTGECIDWIGKAMKRDLSKRLSNAAFCSILYDGSTNSCIKEQEVIYITYFMQNHEVKRLLKQIKIKILNH